MNAKILGNVGICLVILGSCAVFLQKVVSAPDVVTLFKPPVEQSPEVKYLGKKLSLEKYDVLFGQVGNKVDASFTVQNDSDLTIKNFTTHCTLHDDAGKQWSESSWKVFASLAANEHAEYTFSDRRYISHNAISHKSRCEIIDAGLADGNVVIASAEEQHHGKTKGEHH